MKSIEQRTKNIERVIKAMKANYDEITENESPYICLSLYECNLPVPKGVISDEEGLFVDELIADLEELNGGCPPSLGISIDTEDGSERVDEIDIECLPDDYIARLADIAESHVGMHIGEENL